MIIMNLDVKLTVGKSFKLIFEFERLRIYSNRDVKWQWHGKSDWNLGSWKREKAKSVRFGVIFQGSGNW
jgi:hypothetical protein